MDDRRGSAPMNPVTLCGCSLRHQERVFGRSDSFSSSQDTNIIPPRSTSPSTEDAANVGEATIKKKLSWHFMSPYQKYKLKGRKPWKLVLQIFKIVLITAQAAWFAVDIQSVVSFGTDNLATFRHIFIKDYPGNLHFVPVFTKPDLHERMFYVWSQYHNFSKTTVGWYEFPTDEKIQLCVFRCRPNRGSGDIDKDDEREHCYNLKDPNSTMIHNVKSFIEENNVPTDFEWISKIVMKFSLRTRNLKHNLDAKKADCYVYHITATFNNDDYDGLMQFRLDCNSFFIPCDVSYANQHATSSYLKLCVEIFVIILSIFSFSLCVRSFLRHLRLCNQTTKFFKDFRHEKLTLSDKMNFINFWIILLMLSDILVTCGTAIKIFIDFSTVVHYDSCALLLGTAVLFSWVGILRYLGFLKGYNTLLVTLKVAFPQVMRFLVCAAIIYFGFAFCGWVVFGPFHEKFKDIIVTSECLYSLVNGDDMFNTFKLMDTSDEVLWYFSKIYLYIFISLFIFVILSLFIGIICDTYERIKDYGHPPKTRIQLFMEGLEYNQQSSSESDLDEQGDIFRG